MQSTLNLKNADPHDVFMITPEVALAPRTEAEAEPSPQTIPPVFAAAAPPVDTTFRATAVDPAKLAREHGPFRKWVGRATVVFFVALGSALAAAMWKHYGDTARQTVAEWIPQFSLISSSESSPSEKTGLAEPAPAAVQTAATDEAPAQPAVSAPPAETAAPAPAAAASTEMPPLQSMARDLAAMSQQIVQLRASLEQLKAGQEQIARDIAAKTSEAKAAAVAAPVARPKTVAPPPARPHAAAVIPPAPKPRASSYPAYPAQAAAPPPSSSPPPASASASAYPAASAYPLPASEPHPAATADDGGPLVRPPMPLR